MILPSAIPIKVFDSYDQWDKNRRKMYTSSLKYLKLPRWYWIIDLSEPKIT